MGKNKLCRQSVRLQEFIKVLEHPKEAKIGKIFHCALKLWHMWSEAFMLWKIGPPEKRMLYKEGLRV